MPAAPAHPCPPRPPRPPPPPPAVFQCLHLSSRACCTGALRSTLFWDFPISPQSIVLAMGLEDKVVETRHIVLAGGVSLPWSLHATKAAVLWSLRRRGLPVSSKFWVGALEPLTPAIPSTRKATWHGAECTSVVLTRLQTC